MRFPITLDLLTVCRVVVMLAPSYTAAYLTGEMVWTVPTLAAASVVAANLKAPETVTRNVDADDIDSDHGSDHDPETDVETDVEADVDTE